MKTESGLDKVKEEMIPYESDFTRVVVDKTKFRKLLKSKKRELRWSDFCKTIRRFK